MERGNKSEREQMMQSAPVLQPQPFDILDSGKDHIQLHSTIPGSLSIVL